MEFVIDTNVFLNVKNKEKPYYAFSKKVLDSVDDGENMAILSTVVIAEFCAGYHLNHEAKEKDEFLMHVLSSENYKIIDVTAGIADEAARLRSETKLKLPDAIIAATGTNKGIKFLITNDIDSFKNASKFIKAITPREFLSKFSHLDHLN